jgi:hypothetical protein
MDRLACQPFAGGEHPAWIALRREAGVIPFVLAVVVRQIVAIVGPRERDCGLRHTVHFNRPSLVEQFDEQIRRFECTFLQQHRQLFRDCPAAVAASLQGGGQVEMSTGKPRLQYDRLP